MKYKLAERKGRNKRHLVREERRTGRVYRSAWEAVVYCGQVLSGEYHVTYGYAESVDCSACLVAKAVEKRRAEA